MDCGSCIAECPQRGIRRGDSALDFDRENCIACFTCVRACPTGAVEGKGREYSPEDLCKELLKDRAYFGDDGGVTLSGGEALLQKESVDLLRLLKAEGVGTAVDTCGQIPSETLTAALPYTDIVLYDVKIVDSDEHKKFTGVGNKLILKNLKLVEAWSLDHHKGMDSGTTPRMTRELSTSSCDASPSSCTISPSSCAKSQDPHGVHLWIRTPIIPGATDSVSNITAIAKILAALPDAAKAIERWELAAFNNLCGSKYESLNKEWKYKDVPLKTKAEMEELLKAAKEELQGVDIRTTGSTAK
jgi:pyruvate formate lyase activating enzyme